jgi:hypothetical protein
MFDALQQLPLASLRSLAASLREGTLSLGVTKQAVAQIAGQNASAVQTCLGSLAAQGMTSQQMALLVEAVAEARAGTPDPTTFFDLVLSGPEVSGVPTADTAAVVQTLFEEANEELVLVGYAVHNGAQLFEPLARKMIRTPSLRVTMCLDIARKPSDTSLPEEIVRRFARDFRTKHWPWPSLPELFYDPRSLAESPSPKASLHAKCVLVDERAALVTSANFTEAAQRRNIELGLLVRHQPTVKRLMDYFGGLRQSKLLLPCPLT